MNMRKVPGTEIRRGIYHLKKRVPKKLQPVIGSEFIRKSLKTRDPDEAARKIRELECEWDRFRDALISDERRVQLMSGLSPHQKATLENAGGFDQLLAKFKQSTQARNFMIAGDPATIVDIEGVICFSFTDAGEGQTIKSQASVRVVPVHPKNFTERISRAC